MMSQTINNEIFGKMKKGMNTECGRIHKNLNTIQYIYTYGTTLYLYIHKFKKTIIACRLSSSHNKDNSFC